MMRMYGLSHVSLVDVRPPEAFIQGHLPFSVNIPDDVFKENISNPNKLASILGPAGVNASDEAVVVSGAGLTKESALAFVLLEKLGQKNVSVFIDSLNEGEQYGFTVTQDTTRVGTNRAPNDVSIPTTKYPRNFRKEVLIAGPKTTQGIYPKVFIASGNTVPAKALDGTVVHVPYTELLNADGTPKAAKDVWNILVKAGVPRYAELVCFSDDPGEAAVTYFVLKLMGYPDIKVLVM
jgi:thiosulfate/3-mercaptopyruvate sulfurtransferase